MAEGVKLGCRIPIDLDERLSAYEKVSGVKRGDIIRIALSIWLSEVSVTTTDHLSKQSCFSNKVSSSNSAGSSSKKSGSSSKNRNKRLRKKKK